MQEWWVGRRMGGNDGWMYQGRQYHMWFGNGTKPKDAKTPSIAVDVLPSLQDRIHNVGHTLVAGLHVSKRHHAIARLGAADHGRLSRLLTGVAHAWPLGPRLIPVRVLGPNADAPGIGAFVKAGGVLRAAATHADLREAADLVARSAQEMGLDRFQPFLRQADDHLTRTGGMLALLQDVPTSKAPTLAPPPSAMPTGPRLPPPGQLGALLRTVLRGAGLAGLAAELLDAYTRQEQERQLRDVIERFRLDPANPADAAAALAFRWAQNKGPWLFDTPQTGPAMQAMAERVMRAVQADPTLLNKSLAGDASSMAALKSVGQGTTAPGSGIEARTEEERSIVAQMMGEGKSGAEIQAALDNLRSRGGASSAPGPELRNLPPEDLRFSQRTAGGNGRAEKQRQYVRDNGKIIAPVDAIRTADGMVTIDNTRVAVAREHGLSSIPVRVWNQSDAVPADIRRRFDGWLLLGSRVVRLGLGSWAAGIWCASKSGSS